MKTITIEMPYVDECSVTECAYNVNNDCHAKAITVGNGVHPACDTFFDGGGHTRATQRIAGIGACKVSHCTYNEDLECMADHIQVAKSPDVRCMTFQPRP